MLDVFEAAWMAGLFETSGSVYRTRERLSVVLEFQSINREIVDRVARAWDAHVTSRAPGWGESPVFRCRVYGTEAEEIIYSMIPFLTESRKRKLAKALR